MYWVRVLLALFWFSVVFKFWLMVCASEELSGMALPITVAIRGNMKTAMIE